MTADPSPKPILFVGALTLDTIFRLDVLPARGGKYVAAEAVDAAAGMASAAATAAVRLGGRAALWASAGDDAAGDRLVAEIAAEGVDVSAVRRIAGARSALAAILVDAKGERVIVPHYPAPLLAAPDVVPAIGPETVSGVMCDVRWPAASALALDAARAAGLPAILDADVADREVLEDLAPRATHIVAAAPAAALLAGTETPQDMPGRLADRFAARPVAVTAGAGGCHFLDRASGEGGVVAPPEVEVVDTLAAGDVFHGAFALGVARGWPARRAIEFASAAAAIKCTRFGGRLGAPDEAETLALMAATYGG